MIDISKRAIKAALRWTESELKQSMNSTSPTDGHSDILFSHTFSLSQIYLVIKRRPTCELQSAEVTSHYKKAR